MPGIKYGAMRLGGYVCFMREVTPVVLLCCGAVSPCRNSVPTQFSCALGCCVYLK